MPLTLECKPRPENNTPRSLRRNGLIPATIYGHKGAASDSIVIDTKTVKNLLAEASENNTLIDITVADGGFSGIVLIKEIQRHPYKNDVYHLSFFAIEGKAKVEILVPLVFTGIAAGVKAGGLVQALVKSVKVTCPPDRVPEKFEVDISHLEMRQGIRVSDLPLPEGVITTSEPRTLVLSIIAGRAR